MSAYYAYTIIDLAVELRGQLEPAIFERLIHGDLKGRSNAEGLDIIHQLEALKKKQGIKLHTSDVVASVRPNQGRRTQ